MGYALFQIPAGWLLDKIGIRRILGFSVMARAVFSTLTGVASSFPLLLGIRFIYGISEASQPAALMKSIATYFPEREQGTANSFVISVNALGPAIAIFISAAILEVVEWRTVFIVLGVPGIFTGLYIFVKFKDNPEKLPQTETQKEDPPLVQKDFYAVSTQKINYKHFLRKPILWQLALMFFFFDITFWGFVTWIPSYLLNERSFSLMDVGIYGALPYLLGTVTMIFGGYLSDRFRGKITWFFTTGTFMSGAGLYLMYQAPTDTMVIFYNCVAASFMFLAFGVFSGLQISAIPRHLMGIGASIVGAAGQFAGVISPAVMGYLIESTGNYGAAFMFIIVALLISGLISLTIRGESKKVEKQTSTI